MVSKEELKKILQNIEYFEDDVTLDGGYDFNQQKTLKRINLYLNSKFESGQNDSKGRRKYFYNICKRAKDNATKMVDLDVWNILFTTDLIEKQDLVWLASLEFRLWAKKIGFGKFLNDVAERYPADGTVIAKRSRDGLNVVNINNIILDPTVQNIEDSEFVYEQHIMGKSQLKKMGWKGKLGDADRYTIFEMYEKGDDKYDRFKYDRLIIGKPYRDGDDTSRDKLKGCVEIHRDKAKLPYYDLHWEKIFGRYLGMGVVEYLFEDQVSENTVENMERKGLGITSLHLFKSNDDNIGSNIYSDFDDGDIIKTNRDISMIDVAERNLSAYKLVRDRWSQAIASKTFLFDLNPSTVNANMPAALMSMMLQIQQSYFQVKKENFAFFVKEIIKDVLVERFKKESRPQHSLLVTRSYKGAERYVESVASKQFDNYVFKQMDEGQLFPSNYSEAKDQFIAKKRKEGLKIEVPEGYYDDLSDAIDIDIVGESFNSKQAVQAIQMVMQLLSTQPGVFTDPVLSVAAFKFLEMSGVPPSVIMEIKDASYTGQMPQMQQLQQMMKPGGSIAMPEMPTQANQTQQPV